MKTFEERLVPIEIVESVRIPETRAFKAHKLFCKVPAWKDSDTGIIYLGTEASYLLDKVKALYLGVPFPIPSDFNRNFNRY